MHMHMRDHEKIPVLYVPHQKKTFTNYRWCTYSQWQIALIPVVSCSSMPYANMISLPTEEHNRYIFTYITTYPPSGAHVFNTAWITLHTLWEYIHILRKRPQDIPRSPHPRCAVVASRTTDTQPLPHDRDYPQASLVLRGRVRNSHHPTGGKLPSYLFVSAPL
jgi:hypothetical protein